MPLFKPQYRFHRITDISPEFFIEKNIRGLILDVDNTLTTHDNPKPLDKLDEWMHSIRENKIDMIILSNNTPSRVKPFADMLSLPYIADGKKPLTDGIKRATKAMNLSKNEVVVIGDQIFTDIMGGNLFGCITVLVEPIELEDKPFFKLKRAAERIILK